MRYRTDALDTRQKNDGKASAEQFLCMVMGVEIPTDMHSASLVTYLTKILSSVVGQANLMLHHYDGAYVRRCQ
jgi:hypothetical protein